MLDTKHLSDVEEHTEDLSRKRDNFSAIVEEARQGIEEEKSLTLKECLKKYPKAVFWSVILSTTVIMEGYQTLLIGSFLAFPSFLQQFGTPQPDGTYVISAPWQAGLLNGAACGEILGLWANGILAERYGLRRTLIGALLLMLAFTFISVFGYNLREQVAGQVACGIPWGMFQTLSTQYASEVAPVALRGYLTVYVNACWVIGQLIASGVLVGFSSTTARAGWQIPYIIQFAWPVPIMIACYFAPESPWYLARHQQLEKAHASLRRLTTHATEMDIRNTVAKMVETDRLEKQITGGTSYWDCFKGVERRKTEIGSMVWLSQEMSGAILLTTSTTFFTRAGLSTKGAFDLNLGLYGIGLVGTILSWFLLNWVGRRTIYTWGMFSNFVLLLIAGLLGIPTETTALSWAIGAMLLIYAFAYDLTIGPIAYCIIPEVSSTRLRAKQLVIARNVYNAACIVCGVLTPYMLNQTAWNWGAKTALFYAGIAGLFTIYFYFRLPETKSRTDAELDALFAAHVPARKFKTTDPHVFDGYHEKPSTASEPVVTRKGSS